jgi:hypothetical protein
MVLKRFDVKNTKTHIKQKSSVFLVWSKDVSIV